MNKPTSSKEIELVLKKHLAKNITGSNGFTGDSYQISKEELLVVLELYQKVHEKGTLPSLFLETSITLIP